MTKLAVITTSLVADTCVSLPVSRRTYVPGALKVTSVSGEFAFANVAVPEPHTWDHTEVNTPPGGRTASLTLPSKCAV